MTEPIEETEAGGEAETKASKRLTLKLSSLYLDPNNYRLVDLREWRSVPEAKLLDAKVQRDTQRLIVGQGAENVRDLINSLLENGWLDIEPIHVKRQTNSRFLVVEGNRRVATLKHLEAIFKNNGVIGSLNPEIFDRVPAVHYAESDPLHNRVIMALHHISGKKRWPALNQARLMKELRDDFHQEPDQICKAIGIIKREFNLSIRTLALCDAYRESDYGDQFDSDKFNLFREVLKQPDIRTWLDWDDGAEVAHNTAHLARLFSWMSREVPAEDETSTVDDPNEVRAEGGEPVITSGLQVRELGRIISDPEAVRQLDESRSLQSATLSSGLAARSRAEAALKRAEKDIHDLFKLAPTMAADDLDRLQTLRSKVDGVLSSRQRPTFEVAASSLEPYNKTRRTHFASVQVEHYRALRGVTLDAPGRVNLIAGLNNAGKTSMLEALYVLAHQCDPRGLLEVARRRARREHLPDGHRLTELIPKEGRIQGRFDNLPTPEAAVSWRLSAEPEDDDVDRATFAGTLEIEARYVGPLLTSMTTLVTHASPRIRFPREAGVLCHSEFTSPFSLSDPTTLVQANERSEELGTKGIVIDLLREHLCPGLESIELANTEGRFLVKERGEAADLSRYGEGMQRIFLLGTLMSLARDGIFLIDEFENAIHVGLLHPLARMLTELAHRLNVQIFLTTHSQEAVQVWTQSALAAEVVGYALKPGQSPDRFDGERLGDLIALVGFDLRGAP